MQNTSRLTKCATVCGSWPRSRKPWASSAKVAAARSVTVCRVSPGRRRSGSDIAHLSLSRVAPSARSSSVNSCVTLTLFVQLVRMRNRAMSETISSGGFSKASAYWRNWLNAASRSARRPLYSQAKHPRFHTSAQPSPPVSFRAPRSKQYHSPAGSASVGVGSPSSRQRSMKCDCAAERSFNSDARHLAMNSPGVIASTATTRTRADSADTSRARKTRHRSSKHDPSFSSCSAHHAVASRNVQARRRRPGR